MDIDDRTVLEAASWRLGSELARRHPRRLRLIRTHPGGGLYDCLTLVDRDGGPGELALNRNGRIHVSRFEPPHDSEVEPLEWVEYLVGDPLNLLGRIERLAGLDAPASAPPSNATTLTLRVLAAIAATAFKTVHPIDIQPGWIDSLGISSPNAALERFTAIPEARRRVQPDDILGVAGYRFWTVVRDDEPILAFDQALGCAWTRHSEEQIDITGLYAAVGRDVASVAGELLRRSVDPIHEGAVSTPAAQDKDLPWDDPALVVSSDPALRRRYRALQSYHRHHVLGVPYGRGGNDRPVGSVIADDAVQRDPALNFLGDQEILDYVDARVPEVQRDGGSLDPHRLRHNMLSSMPMAFSLAAKLRGALDADVILRRAFGIDVAEVVLIDAEWAPLPADAHLGDRSAFDVVVQYRTSTGEHADFGIETKYTEPLSQREYTNDRYLEVTAGCGWFTEDAASVLVGRATNQLWRNAMLAASMIGNGECTVGHLGVVGLAADRGLWASISVLEQQLTDPTLVRACTWEELMTAFDGSSLESFGEQFGQRYLDASVLDG